MTNLDLPEAIAECCDADNPEGSRYVVGSRVTGTFPGDPVDLNLRFRLDGGRISMLEIAP